MAGFSDTLIHRLISAVRVGVLTGAGISAESGVDTFRGPSGLWKKFKPEELASMDAFLKNPELVLQWYDYRRKIIKNVKPNPAANLPLVAAEAGAYVVEINTETTEITEKIHESIQGKAGEILPALWQVVKSRYKETK
ncbi:hypothetical protein JW935_06350 [candidate division KSB1 bacterium]|nr:hypothetical protein [candidate division KSB1 bacterium]